MPRWLWKVVPSKLVMPGGLLAAMLERVEAERDQRRGAVRAPDAEDAAFLAQLVGIEWVCGKHVRPLAG